MSDTSQEQGLLKQLATYIVLPSKITPYEYKYLNRMNRLGVWFFATHIPIFMLVAWVHGTGIWSALGLTLTVMAGPLIGCFTLRNPRHVSMLHGFAAMCMGGVLVHLGQGPMQIEMHFYFFIALAILALFANPMVIIVAAITVTVQHMLMYFLLPTSVFNYEAPIWVVWVHALFVVLESFAIVFLSRNFYDHVIGLEKIVLERTKQLDRRNRDMRLVLDNVSQGLLTILPSGEISPEFSIVLTRWFGEIHMRENLIDLFRRTNPTLAQWLELGLEAIRDNIMPMELCLEQLPNTIIIIDRTIRIEYTPIFHQGKLDRLLVTFSDITIQLQQERLEQEQREFVTLVTKAHEDRVGFTGFFSEANDIMERLSGPLKEENLKDIQRLVHTLKGNSGFFGLESIAHLCHELEDCMQETQRVPSPHERMPLLDRWQTLYKSLSSFLENQSHTIEVEDEEYYRLLMDIELDVGKEALMQRLQSWKLEPVQERLETLASQARQLGLALGKGDLQVHIDAQDITLLPSRWRGFWSSFVHVVRNAVDHGLEHPDERLHQGKSKHGTLTLSAQRVGHEFCVSLQDDGRGINWEMITKRARSMGIDVDEYMDISDLLFVDGVSSRDEVSETSGRGVGMAAVRQECDRLNGQIMVDTEQGVGTTLLFIFPWNMVSPYVDPISFELPQSLVDPSISLTFS